MRRGVTPTDRLMLGFLVALLAVVAWRAPGPDLWPFVVAAVLLTGGLVFLLARTDGDRRAVAFLGGAYPVLLTPAYYTVLGLINVDAARFHDALVQRWETALFGSQLAVTWHTRMPSIALSWVMHLGYWAYYPIFLGALVGLWFLADRAAFARGGFILTLAFYLCYLVFVLFPVMGPRHFFGDAAGPIAEIFPARLMRDAQHGASAMGTAFPSSHVVACWCAVYALWRDVRRLALLLAPVALALAFGTVYGQFHYAVDAAAGALLAVALCAAADPLRRSLSPRHAPAA